ncbi:hypothetical protein DL1_08225 [Thioclava dalianensis]|uniref:Transposase n=1 Tax=Thioclava dalianensis TaxID=1185766 RepID=A0A074U2K4_9RHOB|nr:hypothetical protein DL1_08225 [Thioclava dalianensis]SFN22656.1 hypothetical protein SAMN05216224_10341 [Thioclava dalianensis]
MFGLAAEQGEKKTAMIDATYLKARRTATSMAAKKGGRGRLIHCPAGHCAAMGREGGEPKAA